MADPGLGVLPAIVHEAVKHPPRGVSAIALGLSVAVLGVVDAVVLQLIWTFFSSGYNGTALLDLGPRIAFFAVGALLDLFLLSLLWAILLPLARLLRLSPTKRLILVAGIALALPVTFQVAVRRLYHVFGDVLHLRILLDMAAGSWQNAVAEAGSDLASFGLLALGGLGTLGVALMGVGWFERPRPWWRQLRLPSSRRLLALGLACGLSGALVLHLTQVALPSVAFGLKRKPSARLISMIADRATDFDDDGYGLFSPPVDPKPFDPRIHPFAIDTPGDGIDEDGLGGDLPASFRPQMPVPVDLGPWKKHPPLVVVFLEGFRPDVIGLRLNGRPVTPFLSHLAREGVSFQHAYVHTPMTFESRAQLFQGRAVPLPKARTLVDDLHDRGYFVAWFSGQDDSVGGGAAALGYTRADHFYDARQDEMKRTSRSTAPISLEVSWQTVLRRVRTFLQGPRPKKPLFLYVNFVDTHYPYWHSQMDDILGTGRLDRSEILPENREKVWRAYLNSAANVDRAIGELQDSVAKALGDPAFPMIVISDHSEAFYEHGILGHGQRISADLTRVPLIVRGIGGDWPELIASSDLRGLISRDLPTAAPGARPHLVPDPQRWIFQYSGVINRPTQIGLRDLGTLFALDPISGRRWAQDAADRPLDPDPPGMSERELAVIHTWEALRWEQAQQARGEKPSGIAP